MIAVQVGDIIGGIGEVSRVPALAPSVPRGRVIVARHTERLWEEVSAAKGEIHRVKRPHRAADRHDVTGVLATAAILVDERSDLVEDPGLVCAMAPRTLLKGHISGRPGHAVIGVNAVDLRSTGSDQTLD